MSPTSTARPAQRERRAPLERKAPSRPALSVVDERARLRRARRRRERLLFLASGALLAGALTAVAAAQGMVTSQQERLDTINARIATSVQSEQQLQVERAELSSPSRILAIAEKQLHMVAPASVTYLTPVASPTSRDRTTGAARK